MKNKGFTLIELLAVIVILAIIALIATPIVLNIISESRESSIIMSAHHYLDAVEFEIMGLKLENIDIYNGEYSILENGNLCLIENITKCDEELKINIQGDVPTSGKIKIENGKAIPVELKIKDETIIINNKNELICEIKLDEVCSLIEGERREIGAKYSCNFGAGSRDFYVLEEGIDTISLLLEENYEAEANIPWCNQSGPNKDNNRCNAEGLSGKLEEIANAWSKLQKDQIQIPTAEQILNADGNNAEFDSSSEGPFILKKYWLYNKSSKENYGDSIGYWTLNKNQNKVHQVWAVIYGSKQLESTYLGSIKVGIRPVVKLEI